MNTLISDLRALIGDGDRVLAAPLAPSYLTDAIGHGSGSAAAAVIVKSAQEVSELVRYAGAHGVTLTPRGAGTNLSGSAVPQRESVIVDVSQMNRILELDEANLTVTVEPGVLLSELASFVEGRGYFYPPDPGARNSSIGGNIATNAGGMRAVKYGVTREYVMGLEFVTAQGDVLQLGSKNRKDSTGLDLVDLIVGSEGTLGIITKATLKLLGKPEVSQSVLIGFDEASQAWELIPILLRSSVAPTALEFMARAVAELGERYTGDSIGDPEAACYLLLTIDGASDAVAASLEQLDELAKQFGARSVEVLSPERSATVWALRGSLGLAAEAAGESEPLDLVVPISAQREFMERIAELEAETGVAMVAFGHAGDGNVHASVLRGELSDSEWAHKRAQVLDAIYNLAYEFGGLASAEHGIGLHKREYFAAHTDSKVAALMNAIKVALDPKGIMNPGISYLY